MRQYSARTRRSSRGWRTALDAADAFSFVMLEVIRLNWSLLQALSSATLRGAGYDRRHRRFRFVVLEVNFKNLVLLNIKHMLSLVMEI